MSSRDHVFVALSGGVDSAVAALRLKDAGFRVSALFMKNWEEDDEGAWCAAAEDLEDARDVCERLDIPLHTVNFSYEYWERVFTRFLGEYRKGRTPNPDVLCNREVKFQVFAEHARDLGATSIATGHYARIERAAGTWRLLKGIDENKDQSYFLHTLSQAQLAGSLFPLGGMRKPEVRRSAQEAGLPCSEKKDSTGICFIGERPFRRFLERYVGPAPGPIVAPDGQILGTPRRTLLLHDWTAPGARHRRAGRGQRRSLVRIRKGFRGKPAPGCPGPGTPGPVLPRSCRARCALDCRNPSPPASRVPGQDPLSPTGPGVRRRCGGRRSSTGAFRCTAVGGRTGAEPRPLPWRRLSGRSGHRSRELSAAERAARSRQRPPPPSPAWALR